MQTKYFKYIFFAIVVILLGTSIYIIHKENNKNTIIINAKKSEMKIDTNIIIGISEYDVLNPLLTNSIEIQYITKLIYEPLININEDFSLGQGLAEEWTKLDAKTYLIKLKQDVLWHDGFKFSAQDVLFTVANLKDSQSVYKENVKNIEKIEIIDEYTMKIILYEEVNFFEYLLCFPIISSHSYNFDLSSENDLPAGTGEYSVKSISNEGIVLYNKINDKNISINIYETVSKLYNAFSKEKVDVIITSNIDYSDYLGTIGFKEKSNIGRQFHYIKINKENKILSNKNIRKVIDNSINRNKIIYDIYNNKYDTASFPLDYGSYLCDGGSEEENSSKAKQILINAGWSYYNGIWCKDSNILEFTLKVDSSEQLLYDTAENIKEQLSEIGIKIDIVNYGESDLEIVKENVSISPDIAKYFDIDNNELKFLIKEVPTIDNKNVLKEKYKEIINICLSEIPFISLYFNKQNILYNDNVNGNFSGNWYNPFYHINTWYKTSS